MWENYFIEKNIKIVVYYGITISMINCTIMHFNYYVTTIYFL